jgi:hypothetical protein
VKGSFLLEQTNGRLQADVLVVGAGPSGIPAAVAAARAGAKVILAEEDALPGGAPVDMYVSMVCGGPRKGIYGELLAYLNERHTLDGEPVRPFNNGEDGRNHWYAPYSYAETALRFIRREPGLTLLTGARVTGILREASGSGTRVNGVTVEQKYGAGPLVICAKATVDATGTGLLGEMAGCDVRYGADGKADFGEEFAPEQRDTGVMPCTLMYITQRLNPGPMPDLKALDPAGFVEDKLDRWASAAYDRALRMKKDIYLHWGATVECEDTRNPVLLGNAYVKGLERIGRNAEVWSRCGFTVHIAPKIGVRECRRVMGDYVLTARDMLEGRFEPDTVATSYYGFDLWGRGKEKINAMNLEFKPYGIPSRALTPKNTDGLLIAGKAISGSRIAGSSYRVQPVVAAIGQAAGTAAALAVRGGVRTRDISVTELQKRLDIG